MVAVRDPKDDRGALSNLYYFLLGQSEWGECFHNMANEEGGRSVNQNTRSTIGKSDGTDITKNNDSLGEGSDDGETEDEDGDNDFEDDDVVEAYSVGTDEDQHRIEEEESEEDD
jgi:hypothetical protein